MISSKPETCLGRCAEDECVCELNDWQEEVFRLRAIEKAAKEWLGDGQHEIDSDIPSHSWYVSGAYILKRILAGRGPKE